MGEEIHFEGRWKTIAVSVTAFVGLEAIFIKQQLKFIVNGLWADWAILQIMLLPIGVGLCWPFFMQRYVRYCDNGISFIRFFKRRFLGWDEIVEVIDLESQIYPIILKSRSGSLRIYTSEYKTGKGL